jgi:glycosyltransferase involved in cell wall biosynthesis
LIAKALKLVDCNIDIIWHHFGDGPGYDELLEIAKRFPENVSFEFHGWVSQKELFDFYVENYVNWFINTSTHEGIPVSIMEAFSFGIPAIATDVGGTSEIVNSTNGFLLQREFDIEELLKRITSIDSEYYIKRVNSYETWKASYNAKFNFEEFINRI